MTAHQYMHACCKLCASSGRSQHDLSAAAAAAPSRVLQGSTEVLHKALQTLHMKAEVRLHTGGGLHTSTSTCRG
jgi:hypothetical protein